MSTDRGHNRRAKQEPPRLQHYVPQLLLRRFAGTDGKIWAYDTANRKMFCTQPRNLAAERYFYGASKHATQESTDIETWFAKEIESPGAAALVALLERRTLSTDQAQAFFRFVAAQMQRTPESLKRISDFYAPMFQEMAQRMAKYDSKFRKNVITNIKASGATDDDLSRLTRILDEGKLTVTPTREFAISTALRALDLVASELARMRWMFLAVHAQDADLIIGDHPVTLTDAPLTGAPAGALGIKNLNIEIAMPLSRRMVALAHWDGPIAYGELAPGMATMLNDRTLCHMNRFVFASFQSQELLARAIALRGTGPKVHTHRLRLGKGLVIMNELR